MENLVNELIKYFMEEASHPVIDIPKNYVNKRDFLRGLINVREVKPVPIEILEKENELLSKELESKSILDAYELNDKLSLYQGDICCVKCDAIINPTDSTMLGCFKPNHNCISNKIHSYAGISLRLKCKEITRGQTIETSKVIMTEGYNLPCKNIIHTVKPIVKELNDESIKEIKAFYNNSLDMAIKNGLKVVCIPNLKVPNDLKEEVSKIIIDVIKNFVEKEDLKVVFNVYTLEDYDIFSKYFE